MPPFSRSIRIAATVSVIGHPFALVPLAVLLASRRTLPPRQLALVVGCVAAALLMETLYILRRVRRGEWSNFDVSVRTHRPRLYLSAMALSLGSLLFLWCAGVPAQVLQGIVAALGTLALGMLWNLRLKVSLHVAFDVYAALLASRAGAGVTVALLVVAALVGWSRLALQRHTAAEVVAGAAVGLVGGLAALWPLP